MTSVITLERIAQRILLVRGRKVLLDADLASLYGVSMLRLTAEEWNSSRSQFATLNIGRGQHRKYLPLAFSEHGAIMAATILNSPRAREVSVYVVRAFMRLRELLGSNKELARRLDQIEKKLGSHDQAIAALVSAIRRLMVEPQPSARRPIGFVLPKQGR